MVKGLIMCISTPLPCDWFQWDYNLLPHRVMLPKQIHLHS